MAFIIRAGFYTGQTIIDSTHASSQVNKKPVDCHFPCYCHVVSCSHCLAHVETISANAPPLCPQWCCACRASLCLFCCCLQLPLPPDNCYFLHWLYFASLSPFIANNDATSTTVCCLLSSPVDCYIIVHFFRASPCLVLAIAACCRSLVACRNFKCMWPTTRSLLTFTGLDLGPGGSGNR